MIDDELVKMASARQLLGHPGRTTVYKLIALGKLHVVKLPGIRTTYFRRSEIERLVTGRAESNGNV